MRGRRAGGQGDSEQQATRDLGRDRWRQVVGERDRGNDRQLKHVAGQRPLDPGGHVTNVGSPGRQELVVKRLETRRDRLGRPADRVARRGARGDQIASAGQERLVAGHQRLGLEDLGIVGTARAADPGGDVFEPICGDRGRLVEPDRR